MGDINNGQKLPKTLIKQYNIGPHILENTLLQGNTE